MIRTPDQRLRVFVSSTLEELGAERAAARAAIERLQLTAVMFELGARAHAPRELYRAYLEQSHVFVGIYWQSYGWVAPGETVSGLEDEYDLAGDRPRLLYLKTPAPDLEPRLADLLDRIKAEDRVSYKRFQTPEELAELLGRDLALLLTERFEAATPEHVPSRPQTTPPVPLTDTVGRGDDVTAAVALLHAGQRLVTLTGPGGIGKTRLALEVARCVGDAYHGGIHYIPLAAITESSMVLRSIAERLAVRVEGHVSVLDALTQHLAGRRSLLLLDNLEQVVDSGPELAALLERCPDLQMLATSRQALRLRAECVFPVGPLPLPTLDLSPEEVADQPAVTLFVDRARAARPTFTLDEHNAPAVVELCRRLDGLPLAIELAAARVRVMSPATLLRRLGDGHALGGGGTDVPERQRTLQRTLDWSYRLLDADEQALFARLSVFSSGWTLEAAEAICGGDGGGVLEILASLLDKSLVLVTDEPAGHEPRFRMLETVRGYACLKLRERGEESLYRRRHRDWFLSLAAQAQPFLCGPRQREWAARLDPDRANLRAAATTALTEGDRAAVVELTWDVIVYYIVRDAVAEPESWLDAVSSVNRPLDEITTAKLQSLRTLLQLSHGDHHGVHRPLERSLAVFERHGMQFEAAVALKELAFVWFLLDEDPAAALAGLERAAALFDDVHHDWGVALTETMLGTVLAAIGDLEASAAAHLRSLKRSRKIDNEPLIAQALQQLGMVHVLRGDPDRALPLLEEAATLLRMGRYQTDATYCLDALAAVALARGDASTAARAFAAAHAGRGRLGTTVWPTVQTLIDTMSDRARAQLGDAAFEALVAQAAPRDLFEMLDETLAAVRTDDALELAAPGEHIGGAGRSRISSGAASP